MAGPVVDAQVHLWPANTPAHPWPGQRRELIGDKPPSFLAEDLLPLMDEAGVVGAVVVPASFAGWGSDTVVAAARGHPARLSATALVPLEEAHGRAVVEACAAEGSGISSVRVTCYLEPQRTQLRQGVADWLWPLLEDLDLPVAVNAPGLLDHVAAVAARHPALRLAVDHFGLHSHDRHLPLRPRVGPVLALARHPNVRVKASALLLQSHEVYPFRDLHAAIGDVVEAFGPERVMWGSDLTRLSVPYRQTVALFTEELAFLDGRSLAWVMGDALCRWLRWEGPRRHVDVAR
jgi:L-fuconolactonase